jgi:hypothetical protein
MTMSGVDYLFSQLLLVSLVVGGVAYWLMWLVRRGDHRGTSPREGAACPYHFSAVPLEPGFRFRPRGEGAFAAEAAKALVRIRSNPEFRDSPGLVIHALRRMHHSAFEDLVAITLRERGLSAVSPRIYSRDGGVDVWAFRGGRPVVVQVKRWSRHIRHEDISDLARVADSVAGGALFVHTGRTGRQARSCAVRENVGVISGDALVALVLGHEFTIHWPMPSAARNEQEGLPGCIRQALGFGRGQFDEAA